MHSNSAGKTTRRAVLASLSGLAAAAAADCAAGIGQAADIAPGNPATARQSMEQVEKEYRRLLPLWQEERKKYAFSSNTFDYWKGPRGKAIVALGPAIIPHLIKELRRGDFWFNVPLALITRVEIANGVDLSEQEKSKRWLAWWEGSREQPKDRP